MDHKNGTDPTPQGRNTGTEPPVHQQPPQDPVEYRYENSTPGPDVRKDGAYFYGFKRRLPSQDTPQ